MIKGIVLSCILFFMLNLHAQKHELGKVTVEELAQKRHPKDTAAVAAILFKKATTRFDFQGKKGFISYTEVEQKIKIYKKEGFSWADIEVPYYVGYETIEGESVEVYSANTYNLVDGKIDRDKVSSQGKFTEELNEYWSKKKISFPNVKEGSIIEVKYKLKTENLSVLPDFQFQYEIPVDYAELQTEIPEFYLYKGMTSGFEKISSDQKLKRKADSFTNEYGESLLLSYNQVVTKYIASNVKPIIEEEYVSNIDNYYGKIQHELQTVRMPEKEPEQIAKSWEDVARTIYADKDFGEELKKNDYFLTDLKSVINDVTTDQEKINAIFLFVQKRMNWNKRYGYYAKKGVEIAYQEKTGNVAEINLMLTSMLRMAGLNANPVLVSTRENGIALFPNKTVFNYVISAVKIDNQTLLLDATEKYTAINFLPIRALNWSGRSIEPNNVCEEIMLNPKGNSIDLINVMGEIEANGTIKGKVREVFVDYNALWYRSKFANLTVSSRVEYLEKKHQGAEITDLEVLNVNDISKSITENYNFTTTNEVELIGDRMYFSPLLFFRQAVNPFKQENRLYPVDFVFPNQDKFNVSIKIPEGYAIESFPESIAITLFENVALFKMSLVQNNDQIQLLCSFDINQSVISAEYYKELQGFYKKLVEKQTEKIVLKKL